MALFSAKQLLDELMGRNRDLGVDERTNDFTWDAPDMCKYFLVKFCPNDLFVNTKADLGTCPKIHDERLKQEYTKSSRCGKMGYEEEFLQFCQSMLNDVDKRIKRAKQRLALNNNKESNVSAPSQIKSSDEKINLLTKKINDLLFEVEKLGSQGKVEEAQAMNKLCDQLREEQEALKKASESNHWYQTAEIAAAQEKQMEVCEVCGAFLIVGDAQQRVDDHLMGKQHVGYARLKEAVNEIFTNREKERTDREKLRDKEREERRMSSQEEERRRGEERRKRNEERLRDQERHRSSRHRSRSRDRARSSRHSHRSKERHSNSKSSDRERSHRRNGRSDRKNSRSKSRESGHHRSKRSRSHSSERRDRKDRHEKEHRKTSREKDEDHQVEKRERSSRHSSGD